MSSNTVAAADDLHEAMIRDHADIARYYTFETVSTDNPVAPSIAGETEPIRYAGSDPLMVVPGRTPDRKAVRLDQGWFEGMPVSLSGAVTVTMWFRKRGQGIQLGNGRTNGMLFAQGDGYWSGLRIYTNHPQQDLLFQIGRPKPSSGISAHISEPVPDGEWHHVATTWDGADMRFYLNGLLLRSVAFKGPITPTNGRLRIGFANAGIGSVKLDVDELAIFRRALTHEQILRQSYPDAPLPAASVEPFLAATAAVSRQEWPAAEKEFNRLAAAEALPAKLHSVARWGRAHAIWNQGRCRAAIDDYTRVFRETDAPPSLRAIAVRRCLYENRGVFDAVAPKEIYVRLLDVPDLSPREQTNVRLSLAECLMRAGEGAEARKQYLAVLQSPELDVSEAWNVRLQAAHSYLADEDYAVARSAYERLANMADCPAAFRGNALICIGHAWYLEREYAAAEKSFNKTSATDGLLTHHRWEAEVRAGEMKRLGAGQPARDPEASRASIPEFPEPGIVLHVAPNGDDSSAGTREQPLASLAGAREAIRKIKAERGLPEGGVCVVVAGGMYGVRDTFTLNEEDSGEPEKPIVYRADPGESPRFSGGVELRDVRPVADPNILRRIPENARGKILQIDLKAQGVTEYGRIGQRGYGRAGYPTHPWVDLYVGQQPQQLARWPNDGFLNVGRVLSGDSHRSASGDAAAFEYDGDRPKNWDEADDLWMFGYWRHLWAACSIKVAGIDTQKRHISTTQPSSYGFHAGQPYYFFNLLEELDAPGEWYLDRRSGVVYFSPPNDGGNAIIEFPLMSAPLVHMENVSHVKLHGLTFELGRAEGLVMKGGSHNLLSGCTFRQLGANGLIVRGGSGHGVLGCDIHSVGAGGIRMSGGDRKTLTPGGHFVENCHIRDFSRVDRVYAPAVHLDGVGHIIRHNLFHDSPHHAMRVEGYEHLIELNEIHSVVYEADDQAGIDIYGNPAYRGIVLRYNFWHHIGSGHSRAGQAGIRLDDFISRVQMYGNVFYRASGGRFGGIQIHGGKDNLVSNNLLIGCNCAISFSPWGQTRWEQRLSEERTQAVIRQWGVDTGQPPHSTRYPDLARMKENADRNFVWRNAVVDCGQFSVRDRGANEMMDNVAFGDDPGFVAPDKLNFQLPPDSPLYRRFGFHPIPFDEIGLYQDEHRATWPVEHEVSPRYVREY